MLATAYQTISSPLVVPPKTKVATEVVMRTNALSKAFGGNRVLNAINLELHRGEIVLLRGDNGTGKTTLINILTGNMEPDAGTIELLANGHPERFEFPVRGWRRFVPGFHFSPERLASEGVGRSWQDVRLFPTLDLQNNIAVAASNQLGERPWRALLTPAAVRKAEAANLQQASQMLEALGLRGRDTSSGDRVSLGQSKRVAIARAVRGGAKVLFLDEPLAGLDAQGVEHLLTFLERLAEEDGITLVIVEHVFHIPRILEMADTVWTLGAGKLTVQRADDIWDDPDETGQAGLGTWINTLAGPDGRVTHEMLPAGAMLTRIKPKDCEQNEVMLEVKDLVVRRGRRQVIGWENKGLNLTLRRGEIAIVQAPNGWGKTTLMDALGGLVQPASGEMRLADDTINGLPSWSRQQKGLVYVRSRNGGFGNLSVGENMKLYGADSQHPSELPSDRQTSSLSGGERRLLTMHGALEINDARVFLLDEPFSALDATRAEKVKGMIAEIAKNTAVLIAQPFLVSA